METDDHRLPSGLWVEAHLRLLSQQGIPHYVVNKGAWASGTVLLKLSVIGQGAFLYQQQRDLDGNMGWMALFKGASVAESEANDYIRRAVDRDPDLWVIEIEGRDAANPFEGRIF